MRKRASQRKLMTIGPGRAGLPTGAITNAVDIRRTVMRAAVRKKESR